MELSLMQSYSAPNSKELRSFGLIMGAMVGLFFGLLIPWIWSLSWPLIPWIIAIAFAVCALLVPNSLAPVYRLWMKLATVLAWINTRLILGIAFYGIILPTSLILRLLGKDPMARKFDANMSSYRIKKDPRSKDHMEKPF